MDDAELDLKIEEWHSLPEDRIPLHTFLGMSFQEYSHRMGMVPPPIQKVLDILSTMGEPIQHPVKDEQALRMLQALRDDPSLRSEWVQVTTGASTFTQTLLMLVEKVNELQGEVQDLKWEVQTLSSKVETLEDDSHAHQSEGF